MLASVLKPLDDSRMFEKFALSLSQHYEVHLIGFSSKKPTCLNAVTFHPLPLRGRKSLGRAKSSNFIWKKLLQIQPDLLIIHAVELLPLAVLFRLLKGKPFIYDIRENYFKNLLYQSIYPTPLKQLIALGIRGVEWVSKPFASHYILAEKSYADELGFTKGKVTVVENKFKRISQLEQRKTGSSERIKFAFTGTISKAYGALEAAKLVIALNQFGQKAALTIAGHFIENDLRMELISLAEEHTFIRLKIGKPLIAHSELMELLAACDFAILSYQPNKSTESCIPTRLYECLALAVPMLIPPNELWEKLTAPYHAAITVNFNQPDIEQFLRQVQELDPYPNGQVQEATWKSEEEKLLDVVEKVLGFEQSFANRS
ncbi:glycosyltransferase [Flammeovirgaceae bacterium SG7u.111]|nr:glycosyltransferase [Flammeovirgaceae bacterium SG7u.111]